MRMLLAIPVLFAAIGLANPAVAAKAEKKLLAEMKAACGGSAWDLVQSWHETSEATIKGMPPIQNEVWHDMKSLKSTMTSVVNGRVFRKTGFNGVSAWRIGPDGKLQIIAQENELRRQRRDAYLSSFAWFFPKRFPAKFVLLPDASLDGKTYKVLQIAPRNAEAFQLWIDPTSHLVRRIVAGAEFAELSDYKSFDGVCTATTGRQGDGISDNDIVLRVLNVKTDQRARGADFDPPKP